MTLGVGRLLPTYDTKVILREGKLGLGRLKGSNKFVLSVFLVPVSFLDNFPEGIGIRGGEDLCLCECDCDHGRLWSNFRGCKTYYLSTILYLLFRFFGSTEDLPTGTGLGGISDTGGFGIGGHREGLGSKEGRADSGP